MSKPKEKIKKHTIDEVYAGHPEIDELKSALLSSIVEFSDDAIISKNLDSIITSWNRAAERTFGYKAEEAIGKSILMIIPPERQHEEAMILDKLKRGDHVDHFETKRIRKDGTLIDISLTISPLLDSKGKIIGLSKIARDITDKKEEETRRKDFISMVCHELKTPLSAIKSYLELAIKKTDTSDTFLSHALERSDKLTDKMVGMIHDFLNLARLEAGKVELEKNSFSIDQAVRNVISEFEMLASDYEIRYIKETDAMVLADQNKIDQVLNNLISNALKYSPKGTRITISTSKEDEKVKVSVSDEGIGIDPLDQGRLFEKFYRTRNPEIRKSTGFGIGLYLVSEILTLHGSRIYVQSELQKGATFWFYLDIA